MLDKMETKTSINVGFRFIKDIDYINLSACYAPFFNTNCITATSKALESFDDNEKIASIAYEFGHIKHKDAISTIVSTFLYRIITLFGITSGQPITMLLYYFMADYAYHVIKQINELLADNFSAQITYTY